jgi:formyltetrahydrofolate-dependent phosphoribosylglycinamide formyltransferase
MDFLLFGTCVAVLARSLKAAMPDLPFQPHTPDSLRRWRDQLDHAGRKMVFTNGCFDLLHSGHVRYLQQARELGDVLIVAINSDASVRALKGPSRPVNSELDRAEVVAALRCVDGVVIFEDQRVTSLIEQIQPHLYAKGGDYTPETLDPGEKTALDQAGTTIRILPLVPGRSTTNTIAKLAASDPSEARDRPLRLAVLGSGTGSNFSALLDAISQGTLKAEVALALSDEPDAPFLQLATTHQVPIAVIDCGPHPLRTPDSAQQAIHDHLQAVQPDVIVLAGFMRILKEPTLSAFADRIINVHPSLLPRFKGRHAVQQALDAGVGETGCSVHLVNAEIDAGRILAQASVPILPSDTAVTLHARIKAQEHRLLIEVLSAWQPTGPA